MNCIFFWVSCSRRRVLWRCSDIGCRNKRISLDQLNNYKLCNAFALQQNQLINSNRHGVFSFCNYETKHQDACFKITNSMSQNISWEADRPRADKKYKHPFIKPEPASQCSRDPNIEHSPETIWIKAKTIHPLRKHTVSTPKFSVSCVMMHSHEAMTWIRQLACGFLSDRPGFNLMVEKVALWQAYQRVLRSSSSNFPSFTAPN
jgi:hypothetical protein